VDSGIVGVDAYIKASHLGKRGLMTSVTKKVLFSLCYYFLLTLSLDFLCPFIEFSKPLDDE
jgi:hypothetical protein